MFKKKKKEYIEPIMPTLEPPKVVKEGKQYRIVQTQHISFEFHDVGRYEKPKVKGYTTYYSYTLEKRNKNSLEEPYWGTVEKLLTNFYTGPNEKYSEKEVERNNLMVDLLHDLVIG